MQVVWTPTRAELGAFGRALIGRTLAQSLGPMLIGLGIGLLFFTGGRLTAPAAALAAVAVLVAWAVPSIVRTRRLLARLYPVGQPVSAEALETSYRLTVASGVTELVWSRLTKPRVHRSYVSVRDSLTRRRVHIPRQLFPDAWLEHLR
ncbi:hypothetical protein GCM10022237_14340 [Nocardioides ginsengisoli]|uniref:DUF304 domain-containing protein n=1 Tax=Nocardioides ginsengisoli TaxID=363868 RepID=A0ABW3VY70_9ACTN